MTRQKWCIVQPIRREEIIIKSMLEEFFDGMVVIDAKRK